MLHKRLTLLSVLTFVVCSLVLSATAQAVPRPSSRLLLPYFEVDLQGASRTTLFAVGNAAGEPVDILVKVYTNWGIPVLDFDRTLDTDEVKTFNLRDWLLDGNLPGRQISDVELEHLQAALSGGQSPVDELYYSTEIAPGLAVGYVTIQLLTSPRRDVLWGDYFMVEPGQDFAQGDALVNLELGGQCPGICRRHSVRFLSGGGFDAGTQIVLWTPARLQPTDNPFLSSTDVAEVTAQVYDEPGEYKEERRVSHLPVALINVNDLALSEPFGWLDLVTETEAFVGVRYDAEGRYSVALPAPCLVIDQGSEGPAIRIEKFTNGNDADSAPGPSIMAGDPVSWSYRVTNVGDLPLTGITVTDDQGEAVSCPKDSLEPGELMICTAEGVAQACQYRNVGTATGTPPEGPDVADSDPSHYYGEQNASIRIKKATNGQDAANPPGLMIAAGQPVAWTYEVTNTGDAALSDVTVTDDQGVAVSCPKDSLAPGESMTCTGHGTAIAGQYRNVGTASGKTACGEMMVDSDASHYFGESDAGIDIEKATNGHDADAAPGPHLTVGSAVTWTYVVTNIGQVPLSNVTVADNQGVAVSCPKTALAVSESMTCTGHGTAIAGQYANVGTATGTPPSGPPVSDDDPSHYFGEQNPAIDIEKATNGHDADTAPGIELAEGDAVTWTYVVTNIGDVPLSDVTVTDDQGVAVSCPKTALAVGESMTCTGHGTAVVGQYKNIGTATGTPPSGPPVSDDDPSHYFVPETGSQGCTPGYWKNHTDSWPLTGYSPAQSVASVFAAAAAYPGIGSATLLEALDFSGGSGVEGAARNLLRAGVAALLNSTHPGVDYTRSESEVIASVDSALASGDRDTMLALAASLDSDNNLGCPLN